MVCTSMKIMLCWSGCRGKAVAIALRDWLPSVVQAIDPWMSDEDIEKGSRWEPELDKQLSEAKFGILCLTPESAKALYIHYEAGALSKIINESHVCPYLVGLDPIDVTGPLTKFQAAKANRDDTLKLIKSINNSIETGALPEDRLEKIFDKWWPELESCLSGILDSSQVSNDKRSDEDVIKEVLELLRDQHKTLSKMQELSTRYNDFVIESVRDKKDTIRITRNAAFNEEFLKKYTKYESWWDATKQIKELMGDDIDLYDFAFSVWPEVLCSNIGFSDWSGLRDAAIVEWALKNVNIQASNFFA